MRRVDLRGEGGGEGEGRRTERGGISRVRNGGGGGKRDSGQVDLALGEKTQENWISLHKDPVFHLTRKLYT